MPTKSRFQIFRKVFSEMSFTEKKTLIGLDKKLFNIPYNFSSSFAVWLVKNESNRLVAYASAEIGKVKGTLFLSRVGVRKTYRKCGLGLQLVKERINYAREMKFKRCSTYVACWNIPSMRNLSKCGFIPFFSEINEKNIYTWFELYL